MGEKGILSSHCTDAGPNDAEQCIVIFNFLWGYMIHDHRDDINKYKNKDKMHKRTNYFEKKGEHQDNKNNQIRQIYPNLQFH